jgi:hypothetical protein
VLGVSVGFGRGELTNVSFTNTVAGY